jgi:CRISPR-associated endonuclease/helicase Cas3
MGISSVTGRGWTERVLRLLGRLSPFQLAYLEALLRVADQRASAERTGDPILKSERADERSRS